MANDLNQCNFIGRLGRAPDIRYTPGGKAVANFSIACSRKYQDAESTEWVRIVAFGKLAEIIDQYVKKGSQVFICGRLQTRQWQDQSGQDRYTTEIVAHEMQMLGGRSDGNNDLPPQADERKPKAATQDVNDDLPF